VTGAWAFDPVQPEYQHIALNATEIQTVNFTLSDTGGPTTVGDSFDITINGQNDDPVAAFTIDTPATEDDVAVTGTFIDSDADDGATLTYSIANLPAGLTLAGDTWTFDVADPAYDSLDSTDAPQVITVTYRVTDEHGAFDEEDFTITIQGVNDAPVVDQLVDQAAVEGGQGISGNVTASDVDGDSIDFADTTAVPVAGFNLGLDGAWTFDPTDAAYDHIEDGVTETHTIDFTAGDGDTCFINKSHDLPPQLSVRRRDRYACASATTLTNRRLFRLWYRTCPSTVAKMVQSRPTPTPSPG
jgi:VCBS repeat-containing protein